jgi:hypothetical protein
LNPTPAATPAALRILAVVFAASNLLFLLRSAPAAWAVAAALACGAAVVLLLPGWPRARRPLGRGRALTLLALLAVALALCILGGQAHLVYATEDWRIRDAVLADLVGAPGPVAYRLAGADWLLRAPVGFYMIPAAVGRVAGLAAAHWALLVQDAVVLTAVLALIVRPVREGWRRAVIVLVFFAFSGWDLAGALLRWTFLNASGQPVAFDLHMEHWSGFEYSSFVTDLFWAPNHALPALALVAAYLCFRRGECSLPALALFAGLTVVWSPLALIGALPFLVLAALRAVPRTAAEARPWLLVAAAGASLLPAAVYLVLAGGTVLHRWTVLEPTFFVYFPLFLAIEIAPILYLILRREPGDPEVDRVELALVAAMLLALPLYRVGASNDLMMRGSIFPLALGALVVGERVASRIAAERWASLAPLSLALLIGACTPAFEIVNALVKPASPAVTARLPDAWARTSFAEAELDTYLAPLDALDGLGWLLRRPPLVGR